MENPPLARVFGSRFYTREWRKKRASKMQTSLRFDTGDSSSKTLKLRAKERIYLASDILLQGHAELDTYRGAPSSLGVMIRNFFPKTFASIGVGVKCGKNKTFAYNARAKKEFMMNTSEQLRFKVKSECNANQEFTKYQAKAAAELTWYKLDFQTDQDLRFRVGCEIGKKVPYFQICDNYWTFNIDMNGVWNVRYRL